MAGGTAILSYPRKANFGYDTPLMIVCGATSIMGSVLGGPQESLKVDRIPSEYEATPKQKCRN
jgi:hypothetical protein